MKASEIKLGETYTAKISGRVVPVRVDAIRIFNPSFGGFSQRIQERTAYDVTNLVTNRRTTFRSAAKFRYPLRRKPCDGSQQSSPSLSVDATQAERG